MCTVYAVEALQTLARAGGYAQQHLEISAAEWGPLVWRLVLAEPEERVLTPFSQAAYWVGIFGSSFGKSYLALCTAVQRGYLGIDDADQALHHPGPSWHVGCPVIRQGRAMPALTRCQATAACKARSSCFWLCSEEAALALQKALTPCCMTRGCMLLFSRRRGSWSWVTCPNADLHCRWHGHGHVGRQAAARRLRSPQDCPGLPEGADASAVRQGAARVCEA